MRVTFCGVRGSTPSPGQPYLRYGGHTSCVALHPDAASVPDLLLDAGTGMMNVTGLLDGQPYRGSVLCGHLHWDHTHGMPFFAAGTAEGSRVDVRIPEQGDDAHSVLARAISPPHFPVEPRVLGGNWSFANLDAGWHDVEGYRVLARDIPHKGGRTFGYRVERDGIAIAYLSDHSPTSLGPGPDEQGERHPTALELAAGADLLITDAQHLAAEFPHVQFLGHASIEYDVELARQAGVRTLVLFHHAPTRTDDEIDAVLARARELAAGDFDVVAAHEMLALDLPGTTT